MNIEMNDLLAALRNGASAEDLAASFTKSLNEANAALKAEKEAEIAAANAKEEAKREAVSILADAVKNYIAVVHPELAKYNDEVDVDALAKELDQTFKTLAKLEELEQKIFSKNPKIVDKSDSDVLMNFLNTMGW
jgi:sugar-specific transcriptional regulator TrmB